MYVHSRPLPQNSENFCLHYNRDTLIVCLLPSRRRKQVILWLLIKRWMGLFVSFACMSFEAVRDSAPISSKFEWLPTLIQLASGVILSSRLHPDYAVGFFSRPFKPPAKFKPPAPVRFPLGPVGPNPDAAHYWADPAGPVHPDVALDCWRAGGQVRALSSLSRWRKESLFHSGFVFIFSISILVLTVWGWVCQSVSPLRATTMDQQPWPSQFAVLLRQFICSILTRR